jgi:hypothetical protein
LSGFNPASTTGVFLAGEPRFEPLDDLFRGKAQRLQPEDSYLISPRTIGSYSGNRKNDAK